MPNPLGLPGPQFLFFYVVLGLVTLAALHLVRSAAEGGSVPRIDTSDPYLIAYLRGGPNEAARVATVALIDRGLLEADDTGTVGIKRGASGLRRPIERAVLDLFSRPRPATDIFADAGVDAACREYERRLSRLGLLPNRATRSARRKRLAVALAVILGLAVAKIIVALRGGRTNIGLLVLFAIVLSWGAWVVFDPWQTTLGRRLLVDLRRLFHRLRERADSLTPGGATAEIALLAAVFGVGALPAGRFPFVQRLYPKAAHTRSLDSGGGCGFSCGSSCGSSCGGGGGGGGCGGCGGGG